eukprot:5661661-Pyramimonas_sp.AAC.1
MLQIPSASEIEEATEVRALLAKWLRYVARALSVWGPVGPRTSKKAFVSRGKTVAQPIAVGASSARVVWTGEAPLPPAPVVPRPPRISHSWEWNDRSTRWLCSTCKSRCSDGIYQPRKDELCRSYHLQMSQIAADPKGHKFYVARQTRTSNFMMVRSDCGKYSQTLRLQAGW